MAMRDMGRTKGTRGNGTFETKKGNVENKTRSLTGGRKINHATLHPTPSAYSLKKKIAKRRDELVRKIKRNRGEIWE